MNERLNIPNKIKIGFQERGGTYTGKLAYITYIDKKNQIAKEKSWENWRNKKIQPLDFDNEPIEGFVLNKKVGGYSSGWNHRQTYCRVYDPRDFEFEISIENLLYILQECTSTKGKGLEGKFVYAWHGKNLVLLPFNSVDYQASKNLIDSTEKITLKNLKIGASYKSKKSDNIVYLGKLTWYGFFQEHDEKYYNTKIPQKYVYKIKSKMNHTFVDVDKKKFYSINNTSQLYFMINENELSPSDVEDYKDKFSHTFYGQANSIKELFIKKGKKREWYDRSVYDMDDNGVIREIKVNQTYTLNGMTYSQYQHTTWGTPNHLLMEEFQKCADSETHYFERISSISFNNKDNEYIHTYNRDYSKYSVSDEKDKELIKKLDFEEKIYARMNNGDEFEMRTEYNSLSSAECYFK